MKYTLPPLETLAQLAAAMASPAENARDTARRAADIWQACAEEIEWREPHYKFRRDTVAAAAVNRDAEREFLANFHEGQPVKLEAFLKACEPDSPHAKMDDRLNRWSEYLQYVITFENRIPGGIRRTTLQIEADARKEFTSFLNDGMPFDLVVHHWQWYVRFLEERRRKIQAAKSAKGGSAKKNGKL